MLVPANLVLPESSVEATVIRAMSVHCLGEELIKTLGSEKQIMGNN